MKSLLFHLMLTVSIAFVLGVDCPTKESISPCTCQPDDSGSSYNLIECSNLKSVEEYEKIVNKSEDYPFTYIKFVNLSMLYFPLNTHIQKTYRFMWIEDSSFARLFNLFPLDDHDLNHLTLKNVLLQRGLQFELFYSFTHLWCFQVLDMNVTKIGNEFGLIMPVLENVTFSNTQTLELGNTTFSHVTGIKRITITNNLIKSISRSMFPDTFNGYTLNFSNNLIETLPSNIFENMPRLEEVLFSGNPLTTLDQQTFAVLPVNVHVSTEAFVLGVDCPTKESISPCTCQSDDSGSTYGLIECSNLKSVEEYEKIVDKSEDYPFTRIKFVNLSMLYFPINTGAEKRYHHISIEDSNFAILFDSLLQQDSRLTFISLKNVLLQRGLQWGIFSKIMNLYYLQVFDMKLQKIGNDFGETMPEYVKNVTFSNTQTLELGNTTFSKMIHLMNITFTNNLIKSISRSMFPSHYDGDTLNFSNNLIETLPIDIFKNMPNLREVSFRGNRLTVVTQEVFGLLPSSNSIHVALEGSPIDCDCEMRWITTRAHAYITGVCAGINTNRGKQIERLLESDFDYCLRQGKKNKLSLPSRNMLSNFIRFKHIFRRMKYE